MSSSEPSLSLLMACAWADRRKLDGDCWEVAEEGEGGGGFFLVLGTALARDAAEDAAGEEAELILGWKLQISAETETVSCQFNSVFLAMPLKDVAQSCFSDEKRRCAQLPSGPCNRLLYYTSWARWWGNFWDVAISVISDFTNFHTAKCTEIGLINFVGSLHPFISLVQDLPRLFQ
jgi:hypothetical protein